MKQYTYRGSARLRIWVSKLLGAITIAASTLLAIFFAMGGMQGKAIDTLICLALWCLGFGWTLGLFFLYAYPDIFVSDSGLEIKFLWRKILVPWSDVIGVRNRGFPWGGITLVLAQRITPLHLLYSWQHGRLLKPGFLISESIDDYDSLVDMIRTRGTAA